MVLLGLVGVILLIPVFLVAWDSDVPPEALAKEKALQSENQDIRVKVYLTESKKVIQLPLEEYIYGVVAAEMPADFHKEALKAQALAARTYIVDRLERKDYSDMSKWGEEAKKAHVTDTVNHQAFKTDEMLKQEWKAQYETLRNSIREAVREPTARSLPIRESPFMLRFSQPATAIPRIRRSISNKSILTCGVCLPHGIGCPQNIFTGIRCHGTSLSADWKRKPDRQSAFPPQPVRV